VIREKQSRPEKLVKLVLLLAIFLFLSPIVIPILLVAFLGYLTSRLGLHFLILLTWLPKGKDTLLIYSQSPIWHDYMTTHILPLVKDRAMVLDWSERKKWRKYSLPVLAFRLIGGHRNFNPLVIHFRPFRPAQTYRFWSAFKDWKHGHTEAVEQLRSKLASVLDDRSR
jgi:hypothetical protein